MMCLPIVSAVQIASSPLRQLINLNTEYQIQLSDKKLLQAKLHEFYLLNIAQEEM